MILWLCSTNELIKVIDALYLLIEEKSCLADFFTMYIPYLVITDKLIIFKNVCVSEEKYQTPMKTRQGAGDSAFQNASAAISSNVYIRHDFKAASKNGQVSQTTPAKISVKP